MNVLLSIKPVYVEAIIRGRKLYEFRKTIFLRKEVERVYIYSTAPVKRIIGSFRIKRIIAGRPRELWVALKDSSGLTEQEFFSYFAGRNTGFAIGIEGLEEFPVPLDPIQMVPGFTPPQSFCYVSPDFPLSHTRNVEGAGHGKTPQDPPQVVCSTTSLSSKNVL